MLINGDCLEKMKRLLPNSVDAAVTDPPYGLAFMNKKWDYDVPSVEIWREVYRVLKPGGHVLSFGGTRTYHRMAVNIEDAGFEVRDQVMWIYGSGFPKSHNVSKAIDKMKGAEREITGRRSGGAGKLMEERPWNRSDEYDKTIAITAPATPEAKTWDGWGSALKPANEPICLARKPLEKGLTLAQNVLKWGTGAINVDGCRIGFASEADRLSSVPGGKVSYTSESWGQQAGLKKDLQEKREPPQGRWPANVLFDEEAAQVLDEQSGILKQGGAQRGSKIKSKGGGYNSDIGKVEKHINIETDTYGASRFFYVAKSSKRERNAGLEGMPEKLITDQFANGSNQINSKWIVDPRHKDGGYEAAQSTHQKNFHPTVKPIKLMEYLITLITPPNGTVLDPFMGSGSTGVAAKNLNRNFIGIEMNEEYFEIARRRIEHKAKRKLDLEA